MSEVLFSHRPMAGVSVGAISENGVLRVAFALTNDGTSRKQYFYPERRDCFSRNKARSILRGRLEMMNKTQDPVKLGMRFQTSMTSRQFIEAFRKTFKPIEDETDSFLNEDVEFGDGIVSKVIRWRLSPKAIIAKVSALAEQVVGA